jgi:hypothetical protein
LLAPARVRRFLRRRNVRWCNFASTLELGPECLARGTPLCRAGLVPAAARPLTPRRPGRILFNGGMSCFDWQGHGAGKSGDPAGRSHASRELDRTRPGGGASLGEGMAQTLSVLRLGCRRRWPARWSRSPAPSGLSRRKVVLVRDGAVPLRVASLIQ